MVEDITKILERWMRIFAPSGSAMRVYVQFERLVGLVLTVCVSVVILFAIAHLAFGLVTAFEAGARTFDYRVFQQLFEMILTVLIALEFNHSLAQVVKGRAGLIQVKTVILIGILVVVRKFVLIDIDNTSASMFLGLAAAILALGVVYWLVVDIDRRDSEVVSASGAGSGE
jgi:uncharacterized membrane protein (DUF373 family)